MADMVPEWQVESTQQKLGIYSPVVHTDIELP